MLALVTTLLYIILVVAIIFFRVSREFKSDQLIKSEIAYNISSNEINQVSKRFNSQYKWDDFIKMKVYKDMFLMYLSRNKAIILPKSFFKSDKDIQLFMEYISDHKK
ncbi:YcxB family protein [Carnobacterium sp.]|uniref:YcxB family protein n=1 Tax=Carnobacterium sp. TaxID=48221 RepID=UPI00388F70B7